MRLAKLLIVLSLSIVAGCRGTSSPSPAGVSESTPPSIQPPAPVVEVWIPKQVESCIASVRGGGALEPARSFNPYYQRLDVDGDGRQDMAVLVAATADGRPRNGLVICGTRGKPGTFGSAFVGKSLLTSFDDDNFVTGDWEVVDRSLARDYARDSKGKSLIGSRAAGDVIAFFHEGGAVYIYWSGSDFTVVEGG